MGAGNKRGGSSNFLVGWKEIASYLGKGVRSVQRYEREMGLPVRRPAGRSRAAVVATKLELDAWVAASPIRAAFYLPRTTKDSGAFTKNLEAGIAEMQRLSEQMVDLRNEVRLAVVLLRESIDSVHSEVKSTRNTEPFSIADFYPSQRVLLGLAGTRVPQKAS